jgi:UDP-N-acetylglucosamine:LPS N-acetylglucosamine transferase
LEGLIKDDEKCGEMADNCKAIARIDAASVIAEKILDRIS